MLGLFSLESIGDANGDGFEDVAIGSGSLTSNVVHLTVFSGSDGSVLWSISPASGPTYLDFAGPGDVNGDGFADLAVGEILYALPGCAAPFGAVTLRSGLDGSLLYLVPSPLCGTFFGERLTVVPDQDGDGISEIALTSPFESVGPFLFGVVRTISVAPATAGNAFWSASYAPVIVYTYTMFFVTGRGVDRIGDLDLDGVPDLRVSGADYVYRLVSGADGSVLFTIPSYQSNLSNWLNPQVGPFEFDGDLNGDGVDDLVGSPGAPGAIWFAGSGGGVVTARSGVDGTPLWTVSTPDPYLNPDGLGAWLAGGEDWSGDGVPDVAVGAPAGPTGAIKVLSGVDGSVVYAFSPPAGTGTKSFGQRVALVSDVNGDGLSEIAVSAPLTPPLVNNLWGTGEAFFVTLCDVFGPGCTGLASEPRIQCVGGAVRIGNGAFGARLENAPPGSTAFLLLGLSQTAWGALSLPAPLPGSPGCSLLVSGDAIVGPVVASGPPGATGTATVSLPIPNVPSLVGSTAYAQWGLIDPSVPSLLSTRGLRLQVLP
jgi:hypothetical protein